MISVMPSGVEHQIPRTVLFCAKPFRTLDAVRRSNDRSNLQIFYSSWYLHRLTTKIT